MAADPLWVHLDFGSEHRVRRSAEAPWPYGEWDGPFATWGDAKRWITRAGAVEASAITSKTAWWRRARLADVLEGEADGG